MPKPAVSGLSPVFHSDGLSRAMAMLSSALAHGGGNVEYCRGILDTIRAQARALGVPWADVSADLVRVLMDTGRDDLLGIITRALPQG